MKIYAHKKGVILLGKTWEVRQKLKEYGNDYFLLSDLILKQTASDQVVFKDKRK